MRDTVEHASLIVTFALLLVVLCLAGIAVYVLVDVAAGFWKWFSGPR